MLISKTLLPHVHQVGYEAYNAGIISDHRGMFLDIYMQDSQRTTGHLQNKLNSKQGTRVKKYRHTFMKEIKNKRIVQRIKTMLTIQDWQRKDSLTLQQIDKDITRSMLKAERQSIPDHKAPWSPKIQEAYCRLLQTTKELQRYHNHKVLQLTEPSRQLWKKYKQFCKELKQVRKNAASHRTQYLIKQAEIYELLGHKNKAKIIQNIQKVEELRQTYGYIKFVLKTRAQTQLTQVTYPRNDRWEFTKNQAELEDKITEQQNKHFHQAADTPIAKVTDNQGRLEICSSKIFAKVQFQTPALI